MKHNFTQYIQYSNGEYGTFQVLGFFSCMYHSVVSIKMPIKDYYYYLMYSCDIVFQRGMGWCVQAEDGSSQGDHTDGVAAGHENEVYNCWQWDTLWWAEHSRPGQSPNHQPGIASIQEYWVFAPNFIIGHLCFALLSVRLHDWAIAKLLVTS